MSTRTEASYETARIGQPTAPVVVGVDGSPRSIRALRWAAEEARLHGVELVAVHACESPHPIAPYAPVHPPEPAAEEQLRREANHLEGIVRSALGAHRAFGVHQVCEPTSPVRALLAHAATASLLVLATSADLHGGPGIGATALACVRHARCPVVALPSGSGT